MTNIDLTALPRTITDYLTAHRAGHATTTHFTGDATVIDDGKTYDGTAEIQDWLHRSSAEFTYTTELIGAEKIDDEHYTAINHLEGDFPGGVVDLYFRFTLRDGRIARLVIEA
jgi:hypothetical protein